MRINRIELAAKMARKNLTAKRLAELAGISRFTLSAIKNGKSCSKETAGKLAAVLGSEIIETEGE